MAGSKTKKSWNLEFGPSKSNEIGILLYQNEAEKNNKAIKSII